jgi:hypothetical protein
MFGNTRALRGFAASAPARAAKVKIIIPNGPWCTFHDRGPVNLTARPRC